MMKDLTKEQQTLLLLLRRSLWGENVILPEGIDWTKVDTMAQEQGVTAFVYDGVRDLHTDVPGEILQKWLRKLLAGVSRNEMLMRAQDEIVRWFAEADIPAVILKGSSVSRYYPQPDLRALGDIDILVEKSACEKAQKILEEQGYTFLDTDHQFHLEFSRRGVHVELHYNVTKLPSNQGGQMARKVMENFGENIGQGCIGNYVFPVLSEERQAMSLAMHMIRHMFGSGIGLRQMLDWATYIAKVDGRVFADVTMPLLEQCGLLQYAKIATMTCVRYLGLPTEYLDWCSEVREEECRMFINSVFFGGNMGSSDKDKVRNFFIDHNDLGHSQSPMKVLLDRLNRSSYYHFPFTKKFQILLPFFWLYLPLRYFVRALFGQRTMYSITDVMSATKPQRILYEMTKPFESGK